jgi:hypothetical protein
MSFCHTLPEELQLLTGITETKNGRDRSHCFPLLRKYDPYEDLSVAPVIQGILDEAIA